MPRHRNSTNEDRYKGYLLQGIKDAIMDYSLEEVERLAIRVAYPKKTLTSIKSRFGL